MKIIIQKKTQMWYSICLLILMPFLFGLLNEFYKLPYFIRYILDVAWLFLLLLMWFNRKPNNMRGLIAWVAVFAAYTLLVYMVQYQSALYYLWGVRNNFRFLVAFFAFAAFLNPRDISGFLKLFDGVFWINLAVSMYQFYLLDFSGDHLGGVFGVEEGANNYTNLFMLIVVARSMLLYLNKQERTWYTVIKCVAVLYISAMAELKFFFVEFLLILALAILFTSFTWRKFWLIIGSIIAVMAFATLLGILFPNFAGFLTLEFFLEVGLSDKGYTSSGDLNRLNAITQINELWLKDWPQRLFGLGLGNCDTSSFEFLNTPFFEQYGDMHYSWMSYAHMYLECGWIGLIFYLGFYVIVFLQISAITKKMTGDFKIYCQISRIMSVMCLFITAYNASLRSESAYMAYFVLAIPFALQRYTKKNS